MVVRYRCAWCGLLRLLVDAPAIGDVFRFVLFPSFDLEQYTVQSRSEQVFRCWGQHDPHNLSGRSTSVAPFLDILIQRFWKAGRVIFLRRIMCNRIGFFVERFRDFFEYVLKCFEI